MAQIALSYSAAQVDAAIAKINSLVSVIKDNIVQLYNGSTAIYPLTKAEAVFFDGDTSKTLDEQFSQLEQEVKQTNLINTSRVEELYLVGNLKPNKKYYFQWLRFVVVNSNNLYQIRIAEYSLDDKSDAKEVCRIIESYNVENQGRILHLQEQNNSGISGYIIHNMTHSDVGNDTSEINIDFSYIGNKISKFLDNIKNLTCINQNLIKSLDTNSVTLGFTNIFNGVLPYQGIPEQTVSYYAYSAIYLVFDIMQNKYLSNYISRNLTSAATLNHDTSKVYIQICSFMYGQLTNTIWNNRFGDYQGNLSKLQLATEALNTSQYFGNYINTKMRIKGFSINLRATNNPLDVYILDMETESLTLIQSFSTSGLSVGVNTFTFSSPIEIGGTKQIILNGPWGYRYNTPGESPLHYNIPIIQYDNTLKRIINIGPSEFFFPINFILDITNDTTMTRAAIPMSDAIIGAGNSNLKMVTGTKLSLPLSNYTSTNAYNYIIGNYIPYNCKVSSIKINIRDISSNIEVYKINIKEQTFELIQSETPTSIGEMTITLNSPVKIDINNQIGLVGKFGYKYITSAGLPLIFTFYWDKNSRDFVSYPYIDDNISGATVEWGIKYNFSKPLGYNYRDHFNINISGKLLEQKKELKKAIAAVGSYENIIVNITDYNNNLLNVYKAISPSANKHYTIIIPEGTYNVDEWFTQEQKEASGFRGVELLNYTKLLGLGASDKIILQWFNTGAYNNDISVLNTHEWHELENITVKAENIRYAVHDDLWNDKDRYLRVKNCNFIVSGSHTTRAWGAGCNGGYDAIFENCRFEMIKATPMPGGTYVEPFVLHDNRYNVNKNSYLVFKNCRFINPYSEGKYGLNNENSWEEIIYNSSYPQYDYDKSDYKIGDCVNMPNDTTASYKCKYENSQIPPYMRGRPSINIGFGSEGANGVLYVTIEGCYTSTYLAVPSTLTRVMGFGNKFGSEPVLWDEGTDKKSIIIDCI